jgi:hypothetical protein
MRAKEKRVVACQFIIRDMYTHKLFLLPSPKKRNEREQQTSSAGIKTSLFGVELETVKFQFMLHHQHDFFSFKCRRVSNQRIEPTSNFRAAKKFTTRRNAIFTMVNFFYYCRHIF